jgi:hypothetical protein
MKNVALQIAKFYQSLLKGKNGIGQFHLVIIDFIDIMIAL